MVEMKLSDCGFQVWVKFDRPISPLLERIKVVPGARYHAADKLWSIPLKQFLNFYWSVSEEFLTRLGPTLKKIRDRMAVPMDFEFNLPLVQPQGFKDWVVLKQHQVEALSHVIHHYDTENNGSIVAISIGGGKTMVGIATQRHYKVPAIVVTPISLKKQWAKEIEKFTGASVKVIDHVKPAKRHEMWNEVRQNPDKYEFVITHYQQLMNDYDHIPQRKLVIIDEAHRYKNPRAKMTKAMNNYRKGADFVVMLTGTFLINHKYDAWNLLHWTGNTYEKSFFMFCQKHCHLDSYGNVCGSKLSMKPFMRKLEDKTYYRPKEFILKHLPPVNNCIHWLEMPSAQRRFYEDLKEGEVTVIEKMKDPSIMQIDGVWTRLRQATTCPQVVQKLDENDNPIPLKIPDEAVKMDWLSDFLEDFDEDFFILYCPFTSVLDEIQKRFPKAPWVRIDGSVPGHKRQDIIDAARESGKAYFLITDALREGANLQFCHNFIFFSLPLTDADREQLKGRVDREGQTHAVNCHYVLVDDSIDGEIFNMLEGKKDLMTRFGGSARDNLAVLTRVLGG